MRCSRQWWLWCVLQLLWEQGTFPSAEDTGGLNVSWGMSMRGECHLLYSLLPAQGAFWEAVCWVAPVHWHCAPPFPLPWLSLAWGITKSNVRKPGKWVSSANWKSRLMTHFLHKEHIIFQPLFTMGSLPLGETRERGIVHVEAEQKKKKAMGSCYKMLEMVVVGKGCYHSDLKWLPDAINHTVKLRFLIRSSHIFCVTLGYILIIKHTPSLYWNYKLALVAFMDNLRMRR